MVKIKYLQYQCKKCKHEEPADLIDIGIDVFKKSCVMILIILMIFAFVFFKLSPVDIASYGDGWASALYGAHLSYHAGKNDILMRNIAVDMVKNCSEDDSDCMKFAIFSNLTGLKYVRTPFILPQTYVISSNAGDCKNMAWVYASLLKQLDEDVRVVCNSYHCWNEISFFGKDVIVDLTTDYFGDKSIYTRTRL